FYSNVPPRTDPYSLSLHDALPIYGRADAHLFDIGASDAARLAAGDGADKGAHIIRERLAGKARFADAGMHDARLLGAELDLPALDRKSTRLNSSHLGISYAVFCLK